MSSSQGRPERAGGERLTARADGLAWLRRPATAAGAPALRWLILLVALGAAGCLPAATPEPLVPTVAGVVAEVEQLPGRGRTFAYRLETGEVVEIDHESALILGAPGGAGVGNLLLTGTNRLGRTWLIGLPLNPVVESHPGCFRLIATGIGVDGSIDMSNGLRLKKAADFDPGATKDERYATDRFAFCVNSRGEVTSYGI